MHYVHYSIVVKKDGRREAFDRAKLVAGLHRACEKRPVSAKALASLVDEIEQMVQDSPDREIDASAIGERVMARLKELDKVAYVRFASVYRQFEDVEEFMNQHALELSWAPRQRLGEASFPTRRPARAGTQ